MDLILLRHGNTFNPGEAPRWIGVKEDLPLTPSGVAQAHAAARVFLQSQAVPKTIYAAPLKRTQSFAEIIALELKCVSEPIVDSRLSELDYGKWGGRSKDEIIASFGAAELAAWDQNGAWPANAGWPQSEDQIRTEVKEFLAEIASNYSGDALIAAVSSGGRLRYFLDSVSGDMSDWKKSGGFKMGTGAISRLSFDGNRWRLAYWNQKPEVLHHI